MIEAYFDGACHNHRDNKPASCAYVVKENNVIIDQGGHFVAYNSTCNVAEYSGLIAALQAIIRLGKNTDFIQIYGDSALVINQMAEKWRIRQGVYTPYAIIAQNLKKKFIDIDFRWIPRDLNYQADEIAEFYLNQFSPGLEDASARH